MHISNDYDQGRISFRVREVTLIATISFKGNSYGKVTMCQTSGHFCVLCGGLLCAERRTTFVCRKMLLLLRAKIRMDEVVTIYDRDDTTCTRNSTPDRIVSVVFEDTSRQQR
jgi:hypothetical protein